MTRAALATINTSALTHNLQRVRDAAPQSKVLAVIKANGYGHGIECAAKTLADADALGVASLEEGLQLRNAGIKTPIVLLEGMFEASELERIQMQRLQVVIHSQYQIEMLNAQADKNPHGIKLTAWLKIDTGMHRLGFTPQQADQVLQQLQANRLVNDIIPMTHLANADDLSDDTTSKQLLTFEKTVGDTRLPQSIANSAGILGWPQSHADFVRPGIMLYGVNPFISGVGADYELQPVMTLSSRLIAINRYHKGDKIGYGGTWQCPEAMSVGVVAIGYGDGYPRHAANGTPVLLNGRRVPLVGRVSMDMITIDLRTQPNAQVGDEVVLWGEGLPVEEIAQQAGTIAYELLCGVTQRVRFEETAKADAEPRT
jgi:alanine racemase